MIRLERILVPTDFSDNSRQAEETTLANLPSGSRPRFTCCTSWSR